MANKERKAGKQCMMGDESYREVIDQKSYGGGIKPSLSRFFMESAITWAVQC